MEPERQRPGYSHVALVNRLGMFFALQAERGRGQGSWVPSPVIQRLGHKIGVSAKVGPGRAFDRLKEHISYITWRKRNETMKQDVKALSLMRNLNESSVLRALQIVRI